jgi:hypothetical protein
VVELGATAVTVWRRGLADIALPDLLMELAHCERRKNFSRRCGARYTELTASGTPES